MFLLLETLNPPAYLCVGNHDHYGFVLGVPKIDSLFSDYDTCATDNLHLISMNSGGDKDRYEDWIQIPIPFLPDIVIPKIDLLPEAEGLYTPQYTWLEGIIDDHPGYNKIIFMHHPIVCTSTYGKFKSESESNGCIRKNRDEFMNLSRNSGVKVVLAGHTHHRNQTFEYAVDPNGNKPISLGEPTSGAYWSSNDVPYLPMYIITDACNENLGYRKIEVIGDEVRVWKNRHFHPVRDFAEYVIDLIPLPGLGKELLSSAETDTISLASGRLHVYDSQGNHVGFNHTTGQIDSEIDMAYYEAETALIDTANSSFWTQGELISLLVDPTESYTYEFEVFLDCTLNVYGHFRQKNDGGEYSTIYSKIAVDSGAAGQLLINNNTIDCTLRIDDNGDGSPDRQIQPEETICEVSMTNLNFGSVDIGDHLDKTFTITNTWGDMLSGSVTASSCDHYTIVSGGGPYSLTTGQSVTVTVRFAPMELGSHMCTIETGNALCSDVSCTGVGDRCQVSPTTLDFGTVQVGGSRYKNFTITNTGAEMLSGTVSESCDHYDIVYGGGDYSLGAGQSRSVTVRFKPTQPGTHWCTIETGNPFCSYVSCSGLGEPRPYSVTIRALCFEKCAFLSVSTTIDGLPTEYNTPHTFSGLTGAHTFTVPDTDPHGHQFSRWSTGATNTTIEVASVGTHTAFYGTPTIPTSTQWGLIILLIVLAGVATWVVLKRRRVVRA